MNASENPLMINDSSGLEDETDTFLSKRLKQIITKLPGEAHHYKPGMQVIIHGPDVNIKTKGEYEEVTGEAADSFISGFIDRGRNEGVEMSTSTVVGAMNIIGVDSNRILIEYRSVTGGKNFDINFSPKKNEITFSGTDADEASLFLNLLFNPDGEMNRYDRTRIRTGSLRNLEVNDRDALDLGPKTRATGHQNTRPQLPNNTQS